MKTAVEKWLLRQIAGELLGNLVIGCVMSVLAVPLILIHVFLLWMVVRFLRGGNPFSEVFGTGRLEADSSILIAVVIFIGWLAGYLWWERSKVEGSKWAEKKEDDPSVLDITVVIVQILFAAPMVMRAAFGFFGNMVVWARLDAVNCSAVLIKLLGSQHRVAMEVLQRELPQLDWEATLKQLHLIPGVVFLKSSPAGLSLTAELRQSLTKQRWEDDWKPPPREERFEFACAKCGQRLRLRRFQSGHTIRCPKCQARYHGRLDLHGRLRMEPEPERQRTAPPRYTPMGLAIHYTTLGLPLDADMQALRKAYRRMMKLHHPDLYAMADAAKRAQVEERAKQINEAYQVLLEHLEGTGK